MFPTLSTMVEHFFRDDDGFFNNWPTNPSMPAVNITETSDSFRLEVAAPGLKKEDIKVEVDKGVLTIVSENQMENKETKNDFTRREFQYSSFRRSFWLPENVAEEDIKAKYENGLLQITMAKKDPVLTTPVKKIDIS